MSSPQLQFHQERPDPALRLAFIRSNPFPVSLMLDEVRDPRNLGAIFRVADACRIKMIYGFGERPEVLAGKKLKKYSRSTSNWVSYTGLQHLEEVKELASDIQLVALEVTTSSIRYTLFEPPEEMILLIGNERKGIRKELLDLCRQSIHLPMHGLNTSLNVAAATGIALYSILEKLRIH